MFTMTNMDVTKETFQVNFFSTIQFTQIIARMMMRKKKGSVIFISSSAAFDGGAGLEYSASKAAVIGAARRMAKECGSFNIRVNVIAPGLVETDMGNSMSAEDEATAINMNIMHRKGKPDEIADSVIFLASDMSGFITGQVLRVDGGLI
jgi:3-oxoacyl-[acyl-carrier protein] reductase